MTSTQTAVRHRRWWETRTIDLKDLTIAGGLMLPLGLLRPLFPDDVGVTCPLLAVTGIPCPLCGMTTSVTATMHLDFGAAFSANPAGILAVIIAIVLIVRRPANIRMSPLVVFGGLGMMWVFELVRYGVL